MKGKILLLFILIAAQPVFGTVTFTATPDTGTVDEGGSFMVTITATTTTESFEGFDIYLATTAQDSGLFGVTQDQVGPQFQFISGGPILTDTLTTSYTQDLGQSETTTLSELPAGGPYTLATLTIEAGPGLSLGDHTISLLPESAVYQGSPSYTTYFISGAPSFSIDVVPEPGAVWLLMAALPVGFVFWYSHFRRLSARLAHRTSVVRL